MGAQANALCSAIGKSACEKGGGRLPARRAYSSERMLALQSQNGAERNRLQACLAHRLKAYVPLAAKGQRFSLPAMTLQERIDADLKDAMRAKEAGKLSVLRGLKSALKYAAIEKADAALDDSAAVQVIRKQVKQRQDSIESFEKGGRPELAAKEKEELEILNAYLPKGLSPEELSALVRETIGEVGATSRAQMGAVMKALQEKVAGRADGKTLSAEVQRQLSG